MFFLLRVAYTCCQWFPGGRLEASWQEPMGVQWEGRVPTEGAGAWEPGVRTVPWELGEPGGCLVCQISGFLSGKWNETNLAG